MRIVAILKNNEHPEYGEVSIPLPIKTTEYGRSMDLLSSLGIGDALRKDCQVAEFTRAYPTLRCLEGCKVNIDELDYLAKRLDGFDAVEITQFQAMADKLKLPVGIEDFGEIRRQGFYYIDKTRLIEQLLDSWGKVNLFTRPRRFGKTLNMSMLRN